MSGVSDGSLAAQTVALLQVEGVLSVRVVTRLQLFGRQVGFLIETAQQLTLLLRPGGLGHLQRAGRGAGRSTDVTRHQRRLYLEPTVPSITDNKQFFCHYDEAESLRDQSVLRS